MCLIDICIKHEKLGRIFTNMACIQRMISLLYDLCIFKEIFLVNTFWATDKLIKKLKMHKNLKKSNIAVTFDFQSLIEKNLWDIEKND